MPTLHIDLRDGFDHDDVVLHVNNQEAARRSDVTTNLTISHAASLDVPAPEGRCDLRIEVPRQNISSSVDLDPADTPSRKPSSPSESKPMTIDGKKIYQIGIPIHQGYRGIQEDGSTPAPEPEGDLLEKWHLIRIADAAPTPYRRAKAQTTMRGRTRLRILDSTSEPRTWRVRVTFDSCHSVRRSEAYIEQR